MAKTLIKQVRIIDPRSAYHQQQLDVLIEDGEIKTIGENLEAKGSEKVEQNGLHLSPGWVDMECHLSDPGFEHKESLDQLMESAGRGGFTHLLCYPNTEPAIDNAQVLRAMRDRSRNKPVTLHLAGALSKGLAGKELAELYDMYQAGARAFGDGHLPVEEAGLLLRALLYVQPFDGLIIERPFNRSLAGAGQIFEGLQAVRLGMKGIPDLAESLPVQRSLELLKYAGGRLHLHPVTSPAALAQLAKEKNQVAGLSCGVPLAQLCFDDTNLESYDTNYKVEPPLRDPSTREALIKALNTGVIDTLTSGHRAQGLEEKKLEYALAEPGMHLLQAFYPLIQTRLIDPGHLDLSRMIEAISVTPRQILGLEEAIIAEGTKADLTLFMPRGQTTLRTADLPSRAKNCPVLDQSLTGAVYGIYAQSRLNSLETATW